MAQFRLTIDKGEFRDGDGRQVILRGLNVGAEAKLPSEPDQPSHVGEAFFDGDNVSFHARPFPKEDAHIHLSRIRRYGFNTLRYIFTWEAIEAAGPGKYDEEWIQHTIDILRIAKSYGFYVFMDPHQDLVCIIRLPLSLSLAMICWIVPNSYFIVVPVLWWLWCTYVDDLRLRSQSSKLCSH
jgi:hypothetical protein